MSFDGLIAWNRLCGTYYGSEDQSIYFYAFVKLQEPKRVLELGSGLGHTALWIAQALKEIGSGHIWSVDDGTDWPTLVRFLSSDAGRKSELLRVFPFFAKVIADASEGEFPADCRADRASHISHLRMLAEHFELSPFVTFIDGALSVTGSPAAEKHPFLEQVGADPIDMLYADVDHYPIGALAILAHFLPLMSESCSIFLDSAATYLPSYLAIEHTIDQLNHGKLPAVFVALTAVEKRHRIAEIIATRRFMHIPITERKERSQNGLSWVRIEPCDIFPYPLTQMRGIGAAPVAGHILETLFSEGSISVDNIKHLSLFERFVRAAYNLTDQEIAGLLKKMLSNESIHE